ncbi:MAG: hypothetical protein RIA69_04605 [Cyclobacteriaceae bacterium]
MRLEPGNYLVEIKGGIYFAQPKHHYLRVWIDKTTRKKMFQLDHEIPSNGEDYEQKILEDYKLVKKITQNTPIEYNKIEVTFSWVNEDGHRMEMRARNGYTAKRILQEFPRLAKALDWDNKTPQ